MKTFKEYVHKVDIVESVEKKHRTYATVVYLILKTTKLKPRELAEKVSDILNIKTEKDFKHFEESMKGARRLKKYRPFMKEMRKITNSKSLNEFEELNDIFEAEMTSVGGFTTDVGWAGSIAGFILLCTAKLGLETAKALGKLFALLVKHSYLGAKELAKTIKNAYNIDSYEELENFQYNTKYAKQEAGASYTKIMKQIVKNTNIILQTNKSNPSNKLKTKKKVVNKK